MRRFLLSLACIFFAGSALARAPHGVETHLPVDVANGAGVHVTSAYSMWRAMSAAYNGPLFILTKSGGTTKTIFPTGPGGEADMASIASFCGTANVNTCTISVVCDQVINTCSPNNSSTVTISNATPAVVTWAGSNLANGTKVWLDFTGDQSGNNNLPNVTTSTVTISNGSPGVVTGATLPNGTPVQFTTTGTLPTGLTVHTTYYVANTSGNTFNVVKQLNPSALYPPVNTSSAGSGVHTVVPGLIPHVLYYVVHSGTDGAGKFRLAYTPGGADLNTVTAGSGTFTATVSGTNDLYATMSATAIPLSFNSLPDGTQIPIWSSKSGQMARNRIGNLNGLIGDVPVTVYGLFGTSNIGACCGTFGLMEDTVINTGQGVMFAIGVEDSTGTGNPCTGPITGPCFEMDLENGIFASDKSAVVTFTSATPTVVTYSQNNFTLADISPDTPIFFQNGTMPTGVSPNTTYYIARSPAPTSSTFSIATTIGGTAIGASSTGSGTKNAYPSPQANLASNYGWGFLTCDGAQGTNQTLDVGTDNTPYLTRYGNRIVIGRVNCHSNGSGYLQGGVSIGEGGDGSGSPTQFVEGFLALGNLQQPFLQTMHAANYQRMNRTSPPAPAAFNFVSGSVPSGWTFTRAACTGGSIGTCATDAQYIDTHGAAYSTYATNVPIINSRGFGAFTKRQNWVVNSDCDAGTCPVTQTTPSLSIGKYILLCNGPATSVVTSAAGTATGTGFGAQACDAGTGTSGTYQNINITVAGTVTLTLSGAALGTHNWVDLQDAGSTTEGPTPHIITNGGTVPVQRKDDVMQIGTPVSTWLEGATVAAVVEAKVMTLSNFNGVSNMGYFIGGSTTNAFAMFMDGTNHKVGLNTTGDGSFIATNPVIGTTERVGGNLSQSNYGMVLNGAFAKTDIGTAGAQGYITSGQTHYLGYDLNRHIDCNCWISQAAFYPYLLDISVLASKGTVGVALP